MQKNPYLPGTPDEFLKANLGLARKVAHKFFRAVGNAGGVELEDLIGIASLGLVRAYERFDPQVCKGRGGAVAKFSTYATLTIRGTVMNHLRDCYWPVTIPRTVHMLLDDIRRYGYTEKDDPEVVATKLKKGISWVKIALTVVDGVNVASLETPITGRGEKEMTLGDTLVVSTEDDILNSLSIKEFVSTLPQELAQVFYLRVIQNKSKRESYREMKSNWAAFDKLEARLHARARDYYGNCGAVI